MDVEETIKHLEEKAGRPLTDKELCAVKGMSMILEALWSGGNQEATQQSNTHKAVL